MSHHTPADLLVLHAVRTLGYGDAARIAVRVGLPEDEVAEHLLDAQAYGWAASSSFAGEGGWSLTWWPRPAPPGSSRRWASASRP
jgi:hypothetical protein